MLTPSSLKYSPSTKILIIDYLLRKK